MKKYLKLLLCISLVLYADMSLGAKDIGLLLDQNAGYGGTGADGLSVGDNFDYSGSLIPRFTAFLDGGGTLYVSAGFRADYQNGAVFVPELLRTELSLQSENRGLTLGRMQYSDPLGFIADGLFDGASYARETENGIFSAGAWYTGLIYKKRAYITMTSGELASYSGDPDYSDFLDTYFAPRRVLASLGWEHPGLRELLMVKLALLGQFDLSADKLHSQYLAGKITAPVRDFVFDLGACVELIENSAADSSADSSSSPGIGLAGELGIAWMIPAAIESRLSFLGRFSSGVVEGGRIDAFQPLSTKTQGSILKAKLSSMSMLSLDYIARLHETFSAGITSSYFVRSDLAVFQNYGTEGYLLGNEFSGRVYWSPVSDIQLNFGGGIFLPSMGNAAPKAEALWRLELGVILSLY